MAREMQGHQACAPAQLNCWRRKVSAANATTAPAIWQPLSTASLVNHIVISREESLSGAYLGIRGTRAYTTSKATGSVTVTGRDMHGEEARTFPGLQPGLYVIPAHARNGSLCWLPRVDRVGPVHHLPQLAVGDGRLDVVLMTQLVERL